VINVKLPPILHRFRDIAFAISGNPLAFNRPMEGFPIRYHRKWYIAKN